MNYRTLGRTGLSVKASACVECGQCETRCPFGVKIVEHMQKAKSICGE